METILLLYWSNNEDSIQPSTPFSPTQVTIVIGTANMVIMNVLPSRKPVPCQSSCREIMSVVMGFPTSSSPSLVLCCVRLLEALLRTSLAIMYHRSGSSYYTLQYKVPC